MRAALLYGVKDLRVVDLQIPGLEAGDVLVRVRACGVCPTDLRKYQTGDGGTLRYPMNLGHEWVGQVLQVEADVDGFYPGLRVIGDTYAGYADYAIIRHDDRKLSFPGGPLRIPDHVEDEELTFVEPLADCLHAVRDQANVKPGQTVVICGVGQMGLQLVAVASSCGARVVASEPIAARRERAREFGAESLIDPTRQDVVAEVRALTDGKGAHAVIVAVGIPALINHALQMTRALGRVVLFAGFELPTRAEIDANLIHYHEIVLTGSEWIGTPPQHRPELYQEAIDLIGHKQIPVQRLITERFELAHIERAFAAAANPNSLKIIIQMTGSA